MMTPQNEAKSISGSKTADMVGHVFKAPPGR